jgi:hypothetical protein
MTITLALIIAGLLVTGGCTSSRFAPHPPAATAMPQIKSPPTGGPYTRQREDEEYGR